MESARTPIPKETSTELYGHSNPGVHSSHINGHYSTQHLNGRSNYNVEDSSCSYNDEESQNFLSLLRKEAGLTELADSSKLNTWSLDKSYISENDIDHNMPNKSGRECTNKFEKNLHGPISRTPVRDSQSTSLTGTGKDLTSKIKWEDSGKSQAPLPVGDHCMVPLPANECGSIEDVEGIAFLKFLKQNGATKRESDILLSNLQTKGELDLQGEPESKNSSLSNFDELEICLPDEDSLLTGTEKDLTSRFKWEDSVNSRAPLPAGDNCMIPFLANESGSIEDVEGIAFLRFLKQNGASKRESDILLSNLQTKGEPDLQGGPGSKNSSLSNFDELEICLPDEDSLITSTEKDLTSRFKWEDSVKSSTSLPVGNNHIIPLLANESGSIEDVEGIAFLSFLKQNGASKRESDLLLSNLQTKGEPDLQGGPESKNSSLSNFDELEICLPDEDSLITVDDYMLPQDSLFVNAGGTSSAAVNTIGRLSHPGVAAGDNRFDLAGFEISASFHDSRDLMSLETSFNSLQMQHSSPQLHNPQRKPSTAGVSHSKSQESQKGSIIKPKNLKSYAYNIQSIQHFPTNVHHTPSQHFRPAATRFDHRGNHHLLHESPVQGYFPSQQMYGQPRIAFPQHTSHEMACYEQNQNAMLNSSLNFNQQFYNYIENASSRPSEMGIENNTDLSSFFGWPYAEFL